VAWFKQELARHGERPHFLLIERFLLAGLPVTLCRWLGRLLRALGQPRLGNQLIASFGTSPDPWRVAAEVEAYQRRFVHAWQAQHLDVLVCPAMAMPAPRHGKTPALNCTTSYTSLFNLLQFPAGHVPITRVAPDEADPAAYVGLVAPSERDIIHDLIREELRGSEGLPVGVQVCALPFQDELVLAVMRLLQPAFPWQPAPTLSGTLHTATATTRSPQFKGEADDNEDEDELTPAAYLLKHALNN